MVTAIEKMSISDKLITIEKIWDSLSDVPESIPSPSWHLPILRKRASDVKKGVAKFTNWSKAKEEIKSRLR